MGRIDIVTKNYMKNSTVFADAFNYFVYKGEQVIKPENLQELDTTEIAIPFGNIQFDEKAEVIDVCKAVQEMNEKARQAGRLEGRQEGRLEALCDAIKNVMESFHLTVEEAMKVMKVSSEDQAILKKMI